MDVYRNSLFTNTTEEAHDLGRDICFVYKISAIVLRIFRISLRGYRYAFVRYVEFPVNRDLSMTIVVMLSVVRFVLYRTTMTIVV